MIKYCLCGNKIDKRSKNCRICANLGINNPRYEFSKYNITKEFLIEEYLNNRNSISQIARKKKCSESCIYSKLKKFQIRIRTRSEANKGISRGLGKKRLPFTKVWKRRISENHADFSGKNNPRFGKRLSK